MFRIERGTIVSEQIFSKKNRQLSKICVEKFFLEFFQKDYPYFEKNFDKKIKKLKWVLQTHDRSCWG